MMPKGVEHFSGLDCSGIASMVRIPMMPKGVEHLVLVIVWVSAAAVRIPMMPKGVEHPIAAGRSRGLEW